MFSPDLHLDLVVFNEASTPQKTKLLMDDWDQTLREWSWHSDTHGSLQERVFEVEGRALSCTLHTGTAIEGLSTLTRVGDWMETNTRFVKGVAFAVVASCDPTQVDPENRLLSLWGQDDSGLSFAQIPRSPRKMGLKQLLQQTLKIYTAYDSASLLNDAMPALLQMPALQRVRGLVWSQQLQDTLPGDEVPAMPVRRPRM